MVKNTSSISVSTPKGEATFPLVITATRLFLRRGPTLGICLFQKKLYGEGCTVSYSFLSLHFGILIRAKLLPVLYKKECRQRSTPFSQIYVSYSPSGKKIFKAQGCDLSEIDIKNYTEHEAVMDLLASSPDLLLVDSIAKTYREFLLLYKEAHKLRFVPHPTIEHKVLTNVFKEINGHEMRQTRVMEITTIKKTTDTTQQYH